MVDDQHLYVTASFRIATGLRPKTIGCPTCILQAHSDMSEGLAVVQWQYTPNFDKPLWVICYKRRPDRIVSPFRLWTTVRLIPLPPVLLLTLLIAIKCLPASVALQQYLPLCRLARAS